MYTYFTNYTINILYINCNSFFLITENYHINDNCVLMYINIILNSLEIVENSI